MVSTICRHLGFGSILFTAPPRTSQPRVVTTLRVIRTASRPSMKQEERFGRTRPMILCGVQEKREERREIYTTRFRMEALHEFDAK